MKKHAIIPIFIPHKGCPNDCIFCNQKKITARIAPVEKEDVVADIEKYLSTLTGRGLETLEIAFFGGSFTGIPIAQQSEYLSIAKDYKQRGIVNKIHLSTRPDYINAEILDNLKDYGVDIIELGVQSFDEDVLRLSNRGHGIKCVYEACDLIKSYGFELGIQLMIGLPGDTLEKSLYSTHETIKIAPSICRLYPTIVIHDTELHSMYLRGEYQPLTTEAAVGITKEMYKLLHGAGINIIRVGLKSTDLINENGEISGGTYHPAFRQLVESEIAKDTLNAQLQMLLRALPGMPAFPKERSRRPLTVIFSSSPKSFSNMIGNRRSNRLYFADKYPWLAISYAVDERMADGLYKVALAPKL